MHACKRRYRLRQYRKALKEKLKNQLKERMKSSSACAFDFVDADYLRELPDDATLPDYWRVKGEGELRTVADIPRDAHDVHHGWARLDELRDKVWVVSHRWETPRHPDPSGAQLREMKKELQRRPEITMVWYDFMYDQTAAGTP